MAESENTAWVYHSNPFNSTTFTTCCRIAIGEEERCPKCKTIVLPKGRNARFQYAHQRSGNRK